MKKLFDAADSFLQVCTWRDLALVKVCLCAMGVLMGLAVPGRKRRKAAWAASLAFVAAYIPLMLRFLPFLMEEEC